MSEPECCKTGITLFFPCSGSSNVGQLANQAAIDLTNAKLGKFFCTIGVGAHIASFVNQAKAADTVVVIDGCPIQCAKKALENENITPKIHFIITELGIKKSYNMKFTSDEEKLVVEKIKSNLK